MAEDRGDRPAGSGRNPNALSAAARLLAGVSGEAVTEEMIRADLAAGVNRDGTIGLVPCAAWLVEEMGRGD